MTRTFLIAINFDDGIFDPAGDAADIEDACVSAGLDVQSVKMWAAPVTTSLTLQSTPIP